MSVFINVSSNSPATAIADLTQADIGLTEKIQKWITDIEREKFLTYIKSNRETFWDTWYNTIQFYRIYKRLYKVTTLA